MTKITSRRATRHTRPMRTMAATACLTSSRLAWPTTQFTLGLSRVGFSPFPALCTPYLILIRIECVLLAGHFPEPEMQQAMGYQPSLNMLPQGYANPVFNASQPHGGRMPMSGSPPQSPALYDPLSPPVSGSDASDGVYHHSRNSSATGSPSSSRANSLVHRHSLRYNPTPSPTSSSGGRRSRGRSLSDDDDGMGVGLAESLANTRKEATRRQRIEAEQRRRDELRDGYARLKDVLPISNQKSSKVSLLERGACCYVFSHITMVPNPFNTTNSDQPHYCHGEVESPASSSP
jgi:hypothetical protein